MAERFTRFFRLVGKGFDQTASVQQADTWQPEVQKKSKEEVTTSVSSNSQQKQHTEKQVIIVDSQTGEVVQDDPQSLAIVQKRLPSNLPADIIKLAAQNQAFFQGIVALQRLHLDEDLFAEAIEDLKKKYYKERGFTP